jgi:hypothetical protein
MRFSGLDRLNEKRQQTGGRGLRLAAAATVSVPTIKRLEAPDSPLGGRKETNTKVHLAMERAGVEFIDENGGGPGVRLRKHQWKKC